MTYGPGDEQTWGVPTGHPHDPRTDDEFADVPTLSEVMTEARQWMIVAEEARSRCDRKGTISALNELSEYLDYVLKEIKE